MKSNETKAPRPEKSATRPRSVYNSALLASICACGAECVHVGRHLCALLHWRLADEPQSVAAAALQQRMQKCHSNLARILPEKQTLALASLFGRPDGTRPPQTDDTQ